MSSIVILAPPGTPKADTLGEIASDLGATRIDAWSEPNGERGVDVLVAAASAVPTTFRLPPRRLILFGQDPERALELASRHTIFAWLDSLCDDAGKILPAFQERVMAALADVRQSRQTDESLQLYQEHNDSMLRLSAQLESRIGARREELNLRVERQKHSQRRNEIMQRALSAVASSHTIPEIERALVHILHSRGLASADAPTVEWIRITFSSQSRLDSAPLDSRVGAVFSHPLGTHAHIHFGRDPDHPFRFDDRSFLIPIADAVALAVTRLQSLERMERIKREWEETFNAILDPVAVLDERLRLRRANRALFAVEQARGHDGTSESVVGRACYDVIFDRSSPCPGCPVIEELTSGRHGHRGLQLGVVKPTQFRLDIPATATQPERIIEVTSRPIRTSESDESTLFVHLYRDVTTTARFEKRILESAKMAELGTIGSSIAHQLNNPIGGMLSHIQLLLMDLRESSEFAGKDDLTVELKEMEAGTRRCAEIVRNLLGFSRRGVEDAADNYSLLEIVEQAIKITELQTRSRGLRFRITGFKDGRVYGRFNLLTQAIRAVLLALLYSSESSSSLSPFRDQTIDVELSELNRIAITVPLDPNQTPVVILKENLDLTVAEEILTEHGGHLEFGQSDRAQQAILSLPVPKVEGPKDQF